MIEKIGIFILFLGPLIFFHELGHYIFARIFGVRVEVFSLGFGPKILKYKKGATVYAISLIPLGGYVKMFGDDPLNRDQIPSSERQYSFTHKGKFARFWIVLGGPLANFLMTYVIFFCLLCIGEKFPQMKLGPLSSHSILHEKGFRSGDVLTAINDKKIFNHGDIPSDDIDNVAVQRFGKVKNLSLSMSGDEFIKHLVKHPPTLRIPIVVNDRGEKYVISFSSKEVDLNLSLDEMMEMENETIYFYPLAGNDIKEENIAKEPSKILKRPSRTSLNAFLSSHRFRSFDLMVKKVQMDSPAHSVGMKDGDVILALNSRPVHSFDELRLSLQKTKESKVKVSVWRDGDEKEFLIAPNVVKKDGREMKLIGVYGQAGFVEMKYIFSEPKDFFSAFHMAFSRTWTTIVKTIEGIKKLIFNEVSLKNIGGPLAIGKFAADSFNSGLTYFFQLMALISVNLGVINLLPIPILDGGHIMFIILEIINRGPISRKKMEMAQQLGLSILLLLMIGALFNDFTRFF